jgi:hypothetical protein
MTRDAKESLTALAVVSLVFFAVVYPLPVILKGVRLPWWVAGAALTLNVFILAGQIVRRGRTRR